MPQVRSAAYDSAELPLDRDARRPDALTCVPTNRFAIANAVLVGVGLCTATLSTFATPLWIALIAGILLCGWVEIDNACGTSHVGTLTLAIALKSRRPLWLMAVSAYTSGGIVSALCVGTSVELASTLLPSLMSGFLLLVTLVLCIALIGRDVGLFDIWIPQRRRQTNKVWAHQFGLVPAAAMWGFHIGIGFTTVISHGGVYVVAALSLALDGTYARYLLVLFWIARTVPIWVSPWLAPEPHDGSKVQDLILQSRLSLKFVSVTGFVCLGAAILPNQIHNLGGLL